MTDYDVNSTTAQLWRYMQHQEEVQHARLARETIYHIEYARTPTETHHDNNQRRD